MDNGDLGIAGLHTNCISDKKIISGCSYLSSNHKSCAPPILLLFLTFLLTLEDVTGVDTNLLFNLSRALVLLARLSLIGSDSERACACNDMLALIGEAITKQGAGIERRLEASGLDPKPASAKFVSIFNVDFLLVIGEKSKRGADFFLWPSSSCA